MTTPLGKIEKTANVIESEKIVDQNENDLTKHTMPTVEVIQKQSVASEEEQ
jgi:hypothetical protein